ncbi:hypothetical protein LP419_00295 [Massilia sp. H-1]|nr:hypothetical protein LP419_00295 [Massilia sp. H-1]
MRRGRLGVLQTLFEGGQARLVRLFHFLDLGADRGQFFVIGCKGGAGRGEDGAQGGAEHGSFEHGHSCLIDSGVPLQHRQRSRSWRVDQDRAGSARAERERDAGGRVGGSNGQRGVGIRRQRGAGSVLAGNGSGQLGEGQALAAILVLGNGDRQFLVAAIVAAERRAGDRAFVGARAKCEMTCVLAICWETSKSSESNTRTKAWRFILPLL